MNKRVAEKLLSDLDQKKAKGKWDIFRKSTSNLAKSKSKSDDKTPLLKVKHSDKRFLKAVQDTPQTSLNPTLDSQSTPLKPPRTTEEEEFTKVIDIMQENLDRARSLNAQLIGIDSKAGQLHEGVQEFHGTAEKIQRKYWWSNIKGMMFYYVVFALILLTIFGATVNRMLSSSQHSTKEALEKSEFRLNEKRILSNRPFISKLLSVD